MSNFAIILMFLLSLAGCASGHPIDGDAERGAQLLMEGQAEAPACSTCHQVVNGQIGFSVGPTLAGVGERATTRVVGMTAAEYLRQSILEPHRYVVTGYRDIMYGDYSTHLTEQNVEDLIVYLLTL